MDDLEYLAKHHIDRNKVSMEITRIFSRMVWLHGYFHAGVLFDQARSLSSADLDLDPHAGNLLIRPRSKNSRSPYNFEIALLDHGLVNIISSLPLPSSADFGLVFRHRQRSAGQLRSTMAFADQPRPGKGPSKIRPACWKHWA